MRSSSLSEKEINLLWEVFSQSVLDCALKPEDINNLLADNVRKRAFSFSIKSLLCSHLMTKNSNRYAFEVTESEYGLPGRRWIPFLAEQASRAKEIWPDFELVIGADRDQVPLRSDGWVIIPKISSLARLYGVHNPYTSGYGSLVRALSNELGLINKLQGKLGISHIKLDLKTRESFERLEEEEPGDYLVLPINFGSMFAGYSARNALHTAMEDELLLLGTVQLASLLILLGNDVKKQSLQVLYCSGDQYSYDGILGKGESYLECPSINIPLQELSCDWCFQPKREAGSVAVFRKEGWWW